MLSDSLFLPFVVPRNFSFEYLRKDYHEHKLNDQTNNMIQLVNKSTRLLIEDLFWSNVKTVVIFDQQSYHGTTIIVQDMFLDADKIRSANAVKYLMERVSSSATQ
jgi:hypothetical protein